MVKFRCIVRDARTARTRAAPAWGGHGLTPQGASTRTRRAGSSVCRISSWTGTLVDLITFTFADGTFEVQCRSAAGLAPPCAARLPSLPRTLRPAGGVAHCSENGSWQSFGVQGGCRGPSLELESGEVIVKVEAVHCNSSAPDGPPVLGSIRFFLSSGRTSRWFGPTILQCDAVQAFEGSEQNPIVRLGRGSEGFCTPVEHVTLQDGTESRGTALDLSIFRKAAALLEQVIASFGEFGLSLAIPEQRSIAFGCNHAPLPSLRAVLCDGPHALEGHGCRRVDAVRAYVRAGTFYIHVPFDSLRPGVAPCSFV